MAPTTRIESARKNSQLTEMIAAGEIAIIPAGFRCHTKTNLYKRLGISQQSLPFDSGFFPPAAVASVIKDPVINLSFPDDNATHSVCMKYENHIDAVYGLGIRFQRSTYDEINSLTISREMKEINRYLDTTYGYYTLDRKHNFVLAHYNLHAFANISNPEAITDPGKNINNINDIMNRRIERMFMMCNDAKYIFFIYGEYQPYNYMMIDDLHFDLHDMKDIAIATENAFAAQTFVTTPADINNADDVLKMIK